MYNIYPVDYIAITGPYTLNHSGVDFGWWGDTPDRPIYAINSGIVTAMRNDYETTDTEGNSYGNYVSIRHDNGLVSTYAHLKYQSVLVNVGERVNLHTQIGIMGNTGHSSGTHLHLEIRKNGSLVNPTDYLYMYPYQSYYQNAYSYLIKILPTQNEEKKRFNFILFGRKFFKNGKKRFY